MSLNTSHGGVESRHISWKLWTSVHLIEMLSLDTSRRDCEPRYLLRRCKVLTYLMEVVSLDTSCGDGEPRRMSHGEPWRVSQRCWISAHLSNQPHSQFASAAYGRWTQFCNPNNRVFDMNSGPLAADRVAGISIWCEHLKTVRRTERQQQRNLWQGMGIVLQVVAHNRSLHLIVGKSAFCC